MTRFARAKGSKASNERVPEEATSWQEMKRQLEDKKQEAEVEKKRKKAGEARTRNYKNFLDELENSKEESWAEFGENATAPRKKKKKKVISEVDDNFEELVEKIDRAIEREEEEEEVEDKTVKKKKKRVREAENGDVNKITPNKNKKQNKKRKSSFEDDGAEVKKAKLDGNKNKKQKKQTGKKKNKEVKKSYDQLSEEEKKKVDKKREKHARQAEKRKQMKIENAKLNGTQENDQLPNTPNQTATRENRKRKLPKHKDKEHKRRKPDSQQSTMNINGVEMKISYFDGFPIKSEDAGRLQQLKKEMISKGIPRSEIQAALKLERRKAEKALAREKKKVCFNCRKSGHVLSECPNLNENANQETISSGVCFKCGSTEHTHFECKVVRTDNYKFATCFICKEQGHISRQCPDNNKGLYPRGGACKVCGDVTHLKKDCPKYQAQQEALSVQVDSLSFENVESLDNKNSENNVRAPKTNKVIKF